MICEKGGVGFALRRGCPPAPQIKSKKDRYISSLCLSFERESLAKSLAKSLARIEFSDYPLGEIPIGQFRGKLPIDRQKKSVTL